MSRSDQFWDDHFRVPLQTRDTSKLSKIAIYQNQGDSTIYCVYQQESEQDTTNYYNCLHALFEAIDDRILYSTVAYASGNTEQKFMALFVSTEDREAVVELSKALVKHGLATEEEVLAGFNNIVQAKDLGLSSAFSRFSS